MRCSRARTLISLAEDSLLTAREERALREHAEGCSACAAHARRIQSTMEGLLSAAQTSSADSTAERFSERLHSALLAEQRVNSRRPLARLSRLVDSVLPPHRLSARAVRLAAALVGLLAVSLWLSGQIVTTSPIAARDYSFGHIASFRARVSGDGRVYAALSERRAPGRQQLREEWLR